MKLKDSIEKIFGKTAFDHGIFYNYDYGLRFELSESGDPIGMFTVAYPKAMEIAQEALKNSSEIQICWTFYGGGNHLSSLSAFKEFFDLGIKIPEDREIWAEKDEEDLFRHFILFTVPKKYLKNVIWGALAQDLDIRPRVVGSLYIYCLTTEILLHPYDDRGMDLIAPNKEYAKDLFIKFNHYLLDYDRAAMESAYGRF
ncbi:MAG: DUF3885 domain-containing protein [Fluviicoccus sp.]|uniref:DUF3885 domain-containing protein n=1 Tax=Fluviicoccus sp. TaxID=2003552 RepID=UPI0027269487|nr:DUF3885 domain-containing protein [Fluviicoccus sp.]MDO8331637.1 DUF3885 domain-containing protein [Fluviicoccus sp.]